VKRGFDNPITATLGGLLDRGRTTRTLAPLGPGERLDGRTALVTGANRGLGLAIAQQLAARGARLILACRSGQDDTRAKIVAVEPSAQVQVRALDLSDFASVRALCDGLRDDGERVDRLVLNAGVVPARARRTQQGFEIQFGVNYLANVLLTGRLLSDGVIPNSAFAGAPCAGDRPRIVMVSSETHRDVERIDFSRFGYYEAYGAMGGVKVYGYSKLLLNTYAAELDRRLNSDHVDVAVHTTCPGAVNTDIAREAPGLAKPLLKLVMRAFFRDPQQAAEPILYLCCARALEGVSGKYLHLMHDKAASACSLDPDVGRQLWERSAALIEHGCAPA